MIRKMYVNGPASAEPPRRAAPPPGPGALGVSDGGHQCSTDLIRRTIRKLTREITAISRKSAQPIADA